MITPTIDTAGWMMREHGLVYTWHYFRHDQEMWRYPILRIMLAAWFHNNHKQKLSRI